MIRQSGVVASAVGEFARELRRRHGSGLLDVRLFGSHARGEANEDSDVDIAVVLEVADFAARRQIIDLATDIGLPRGLRLSPTVFDRATFEKWRTQERALIIDIVTEGIPA